MAGLRNLSVLHFAILFLLITSAACTRPEADKTSIAFTLPSPHLLSSKAERFSKLSSLEAQSVSVMSGEEYGVHISLNVTGDGVNIFCSFDSNSGVEGPCKFPNSNTVEVDVPSGNNRLFQVFYAVDEENGTTMNYGETVKTLTGSSTSVPITVSPITAGSPDMGHISGRYIDGTSGTPIYDTGLLRIRYKPASGSPPMVVMEKEVFQGWFQALSIENITFSYEINGKNWFPAYPNGLRFQDFETIRLANAGRFSQTQDGTRYETVGWWGPGASSQTAVTSEGSCSVNHFSTCLFNGANGSSSFIGPFKATGNRIFTTKTNSSGVDYLTYNFLPGVADVIDVTDIKVYKITGVTDASSLKPYFMDEGKWNCAKVDQQSTIAGSGITLISTTPFASLVNVASSKGINLHSVFASLVPSDVLISCPMRGAATLTSAVLYPNQFNSFSHGGYNGPYLHLNISGASPMMGTDSYRLLVGQCYELNAGSYMGQGSSYISSALVSIGSFAAPQIQFYNEPSCTSVGGSLTINSSSSTSTTGAVYLKPTAEGTGQITYTYTSSLNEHAAFPQSYVVEKPIMKIVGPQKLAQNECALYEIVRRDSQGNQAQVSTTLPLTLNTVSGLSYWYNADCTSSASSLSMPGNSSQVQFYVRRDASTGDLGLNLNATAHGTTHLLQGLTIGVRSGSSLFEKLAITFDPASSNLVPGQCYTIRFALTNAQNEEIPAKTGISLPISIGNGKVYENSCGGDPIEQIQFAPGKSVVFYKFIPTSLMASTVLPVSIPSSPVAIAAPSVSIGANGSAPVLALPKMADTGTMQRWTNKIVGAHEFGSARPLQLSPPSLGNIRCQKYDRMNWNNLGDCSSYINQSTGVFSWPVSSAIANHVFRFEISGSGGSFASIIFDPKSYFGPDFRVIPCDVTLPATTEYVDASDLNWEFVNNGRTTICVGKKSDGTPAQGSFDATIPLTSNRKLIGWIGAADTERFVLSGNNSFQASGDISSSSDIVLANFSVVSGQGPILSLPNSTTATIPTRIVLRNLGLVVTGNVFDIAQISSGDTDIEVDAREVLFQSNSNSSLNFLNITSPSGALKFREISFKNLGTPASPSDISNFVRMTASTSGPFGMVAFERVEMEGPGRMIQMSSTGAGLLSSQMRRVHRKSTTSTLGFTAGGHVDLEGNSELVLANSRIVGSNNSPLVRVTGSMAPHLYSYGNQWIQKTNSPAIQMDNTAGADLRLASNHFLRVANTGTTAPFIDAPALGAPLLISSLVSMPPASPFSLPGFAENRICSIASANWAAPNLNGQGFDGSSLLLPTFTTSAVDLVADQYSACTAP